MSITAGYNPSDIGNSKICLNEVSVFVRLPRILHLPVIAAVIPAICIGCGASAPSPIAEVAPAPSSPTLSVSRADRPRLVGSNSCNGSQCHGSASPKEGEFAFNEFVRFVEDDIHSEAYAVLLSNKAIGISKRLSADRYVPPYQDSKCLACHVTPESSGELNLVRIHLNGVGCESCHGAAVDWLGPHTSPGWSRSAGDKKGMVNVRDPIALAERCVGCHVGAPGDGIIPPREVNHDIIAAGHPQLTFELTHYLRVLSPHWNERTKTEEQRDELKEWLVGQLASSRAALSLLHQRAQRIVAESHGEIQTWPEFADLDCYACHRNITADPWKDRIKPAVPFRTGFHFAHWHLTGPSWLPRTFADDSLDMQPFQNALAKLRSADALHVSPREVEDQTHVLISNITAWLADNTQGGIAQIQERFEEIRKNAMRRSPDMSWDQAAQTYLFLETLARANELPHTKLSGHEKWIQDPGQFSSAKDGIPMTDPANGQPK